MTLPPDPDIGLDVNLRNPGQFFACCGVLELASRLWPGSEGWFTSTEGRTSFNVATGSGRDDPLGELVEKLISDGPIVELAADADRYAGDRQPVVLREPFRLRLDWWLDSYRGGDKSELKVWAGQQTPERNFNALRDAWRDLMTSVADDGDGGRRLLSRTWPMTGRFGFDPSAAPTSIDVGFSTDEQGIPVQTSPATEILAAIGLQRFRPVSDVHSRGRWFVFTAWTDPVEISVAPAAAVGLARAVETNVFPVTMRNAQYGNFGWAKRWEQKR